MAAAVPTTILVVDDDEHVRDLAISVLEDDGYRVVGAGDGAEALAALGQHPEIDLLFTDIMMPGIDGFVLADMAKASRPQLKVVYATGYHDLFRSQPRPIHGVILGKPYRPARLQEAVKTALER